MCDCEFDPEFDQDDPDGSWHYRRTCEHCGRVWEGLHCPHDGHQNPCPSCGIRPTPISANTTEQLVARLTGGHMADDMESDPKAR
jgi:hypothetical protein